MRQLQIISGVATLAVVLTLLSYQTSVTKLPEAESIEVLRSLRSKLADAEARAASAEARASTLSGKLASLSPSGAPRVSRVSCRAREGKRGWRERMRWNV